MNWNPKGLIISVLSIVIKSFLPKETNIPLENICDILFSIASEFEFSVESPEKCYSQVFEKCVSTLLDSSESEFEVNNRDELIEDLAQLEIKANNYTSKNDIICEIRNSLKKNGVYEHNITNEDIERFAEKLFNSFENAVIENEKSLSYYCYILVKRLESKINAQSENGYEISYQKAMDLLDETSFRRILWEESKIRFCSSIREGGRFYNKNIIRRLLPYGYFSSSDYSLQATSSDGNEATLVSLFAHSNLDLAIIGDGGIGKTTFLQHLMQEEFLDNSNSVSHFDENRPVPFFVELNRCPENICEWYNPLLHKTNFITRYICQILENHLSLDCVKEFLLERIEKEMQKVPKNGKPQYLLLLDGFNEVKSNNSTRSFLSEEISILHEYPNVRIVTTSRETQSAYFTSHFELIRVSGLKEKQIIIHLKRCGMLESEIGEVKSCASLMNCLKIPLYLYIFSSNRISNSQFIPQTAGEILYCFFHGESAFYNTRMRIEQIHTLELSKKQLSLILDFVLPYIGWFLEESDSFSLPEQEFYDVIRNSFEIIKKMFTCESNNPFRTFDYNGKVLNDTINFFYNGQSVNYSLIVSCLYDYLGIIYKYNVNSGKYSDRIRYSFCHHHFRDYFSAVWNVKTLFMLECISPKNFNTIQDDLGNSLFRKFLDDYYWNHEKISFISEILMEQRNRPYFDKTTKNWLLPVPKYDEQKLLINSLDFCRKLYHLKIGVNHIIQNILSAILYGRNEYSGLNLTELDLSKCNFYNVTCSRIGNTRNLNSDFSRSKLCKKCFKSEYHYGTIIEFLYHNNRCFTIGKDGTVKCWDVLSGRLDYELHTCIAGDCSSKGFIKISNNGQWLAVKSKEEYKGQIKNFIKLYELDNIDIKPKIIKANIEYNRITYYNFTEDSKSLIMILDQNVVYCVNIETQTSMYNKSFNFFKESELYACSTDSEIYVYTFDYDIYKIEENYIKSKYMDEDEQNNDELDDCIVCEIYVISPDLSKMELLHSFESPVYILPIVLFDETNNRFIYYNYNGNHIEMYDCLSRNTMIVLEQLTKKQIDPPIAIYKKQSSKNEYYILYSDICFVVEISLDTGDSILFSYSISAVQRLLDNSGEGTELEFCVPARINENRLIVSDGNNTYEWDIVHDRLIRKYGITSYICSSFFSNNSSGVIILVSENNGISVFGNNPMRLIRQYCFTDQDYSLQYSAYNSAKNVLATVHVRQDHERVILLDLVTGQDYIIFSSTNYKETITNLCFSDNGVYLLLTTQYRCMEYDLRKKNNPYIVAFAKGNKRFVSGTYKGEEIEIAVVDHLLITQHRVKPYCIYYSRKICVDKVYYEPKWYYLMPKLTAELFDYFIYSYGDLGVEGGIKPNGIQSYWVTSGFFLEELVYRHDDIRTKIGTTFKGRDTEKQV